MGVADRGIMPAISSTAARPETVFSPQYEKPKHASAATSSKVGKLRIDEINGWPERLAEQSP